MTTVIMIVKDPKSTHIRIPDELCVRTDLNWNQKAILGAIGRLQDRPPNNGASCTTTHEYIGSLIGLSGRAVKDEINGTSRGKPGIPKADLNIVRSTRRDGDARNPPNHYSATWAYTRAQRRKQAAKKAAVLPFPASQPDPSG